MLIDWFTVIAQLINFLILAWLLNRFLYHRILKAIDAREQHIHEMLEDATLKRAEALTEKETLNGKNKDFDQQRAKMLEQAAEEVASKRQQLLLDAQQAANALKETYNKTRMNDAKSFKKNIRLKAQQSVFQIAHKALKELANVELEAQIVRVFIERFESLDAVDKKLLAKGFFACTVQAPASIRTCFELTQAQQARINTAINNSLALEAELNFELKPEISSGIELNAGGQKLAWNINDYLESMEHELATLLKTSAQNNTQDAKPSSES